MAAYVGKAQRAKAAAVASAAADARNGGDPAIVGTWVQTAACAAGTEYPFPPETPVTWEFGMRTLRIAGPPDTPVVPPVPYRARPSVTPGTPGEIDIGHAGGGAFRAYMWGYYEIDGEEMVARLVNRGPRLVGFETAKGDGSATMRFRRLR